VCFVVAFATKHFWLENLPMRSPSKILTLDASMGPKLLVRCAMDSADHRLLRWIEKRNALGEFHRFQDESMPWALLLLLLLCLLSLSCNHCARITSPWVFCDRAGMFVVTYNNIIWKMYRCDNEYCCTYLSVRDFPESDENYYGLARFWTSRSLFFVLFINRFIFVFPGTIDILIGSRILAFWKSLYSWW